MMEQSHALFHKCDPELLSRGKDSLVVLTAGWGRDVLGSRPGSSEDVVDEGELNLS